MYYGKPQDEDKETFNMQVQNPTKKTYNILINLIPN
jgi:hypothetical protein